MKNISIDCHMTWPYVDACAKFHTHVINTQIKVYTFKPESFNQSVGKEIYPVSKRHTYLVY